MRVGSSDMRVGSSDMGVGSREQHTVSTYPPTEASQSCTRLLLSEQPWRERTKPCMCWEMVSERW